MITKIDLSGFRNLRFSKAGLTELTVGIDRLPCIRSLSLKHNGISDEHDKEILNLMNVTKIKYLDLSCNEMNKLGFAIGKKLRDEAVHFIWLDLTQNDFSTDANANSTIIQGFKKQPNLQYAGLTT